MGKKILILPDIHGRTFWKEAVDGDFDEIVFLGDYLDHYSFDDVDTISTLKNFQEILEWRNAQKERPITMLYGNHDYHYINGDEYGCRMDYQNKKKITELFKTNKNLFQFCRKIDNVVFTHAGITLDWLDSFTDEKIDNIEDFINSLNGSPALTMVSAHRGGRDQFSSCIWADIVEFTECSMWGKEQGIVQIFAHTRMRKSGAVVCGKYDGSKDVDAFVVSYGDIPQSDFYMIDSATPFVFDMEQQKLMRLNEVPIEK